MRRLICWILIVGACIVAFGGTGLALTSDYDRDRLAGVGFAFVGLVGAASITAYLYFSVSSTVVGRLNMIATRNIDSSATYTMLQVHSGGENADFRAAKATTMEDSCDVLVRSVPGGEYVRNAKILRVENWRGSFYVAQGDVWGVRAEKP